MTDDATRAMVTDPSNRVTNADLNIKAHEWLFEYDIEEAATTHWHNVGQPDTRPIRAKWVARLRAVDGAETALEAHPLRQHRWPCCYE